MDIFDFFGLDDNFVILNIFLQVTLFSAVAIMVARYFKHNAAVRYAILYPALLSLSVLVVASLVLQTSSRNMFFIPIMTTTEPPGSLALGELPEAYFLDAPPLELFQLPLSAESPTLTEAGEQTATGLAVEQNTTINTPWELFLSLPLYLIIAIIWVGGFLFLTIGLLRSFHNVEMMSRQSKNLSSEDRALLNDVLAQHLDDVGRLRFRTSSLIDSPVLAGLTSPVVLLPNNFVQELNHQQLKNVLLHELAHYARSDAMANFLQKVCMAVFWFHPLVHVMDGMICRAREEICDNYVLSEEEAINYSETLLHVSSFSSYKRNGYPQSHAVNTKTTINSRAGDIKLAMGVFSSEWKLEQRISELISDHREKTMKLATSTNRAVQAVLVCFSISLAACQVGAAENLAPIAVEPVPLISQEPSQAIEPVEPVEETQSVAAARDQQQRVRELEERERGEVQLDIEQLGQRLESERQRIQQEAERLELRALELERRARQMEEEFAGREDELVQRMDEVRRRMDELDPDEIEREVRESIDIEALHRDIEQTIDVEEIERTVYAAMEQLRQNLEEIRRVIREQGDRPDLEQINEMLERSFNDSLSPDNASNSELPEDALLRLLAMQRYLMVDQSDLADLDQRLENIAGQFPLPTNAAYLNSYATADRDRSDAAQPRYIQVQDTRQPATSQSTTTPSTLPRATGTLGPGVMRAISEIQQLMVPSDDAEPDLAAAKLALDTLYEQRFERMNDFEKQTLLNFYTNYYLQVESYGEAIGVLERILTVATITDDTQLRTLRSLGQLYAAQEQWQESIASYAQWRQASVDESELVYRGLSYAYYQLEDFTSALPYWQSYMELQRDREGELDREDYSYLNGLYFVLEDFEAALENTKQMILLFNQQKDWDNLRVIYATLNQEVEVELVEQEREQLLGALEGSADSQATADSSTQIPAAASFQTTQRATPEAIGGDYLPLVAIAPQYPTRAAQRGIQGWTLLQFDVDAGGTVDEDSITVVDAEPANIFDRSSIRALGRFKYQPPLENGAAVAVADVKYLFRYQLQQ